MSSWEGSVGPGLKSFIRGINSGVFSLSLRGDFGLFPDPFSMVKGKGLGLSFAFSFGVFLVNGTKESSILRWLNEPWFGIFNMVLVIGAKNCLSVSPSCNLGGIFSLRYNLSVPLLSGDCNILCIGCAS